MTQTLDIATQPWRAPAPVVMQPAAPLVSIVICAHNAGADYLQAAIDSILRQTYSNLEVLVIDDGSTDDSIDQVQRQTSDHRIRWISQPHSGKPTALNRALREMRGEFYAIQDADDLSHPTRIERQVTTLLQNPDLAIVFCGYDLILDSRRTAPIFFERSRERCRKMIDLYRLPQHDPTATYRVSLVKDFSYEPSLRIGQGIDYVMQIGERHPMLVMGECLYTYRVHNAGVTKRDPSQRLPYLMQVRRRAMQRRGIDTSYLDAMADLQPRRKWRHRDLDNNLAARFVESVVCLLQSRKRFAALRTGLTGASLHPLDAYYWKAFVYALLPLAWVRRLRRSWV